MAKVSIIILNWNGLNDTLECLDSVYRLDYPDFEVIVIDNCSSDDSVEVIRWKFPQVVLIENSKNLGFTGGNNVGMKYAMSAGADYVWLLNNDTVVESDTISKLVDEAEKSPENGLVSPLIYYYDTPEKVQFIGANLDFSNCGTIPVADLEALCSESIQRNLVLYGTALLIKKSVIDSIGYLSDIYFAYQEDFDYSLRALEANFRTKVRLDARIFHKDSQSTKGKGTPMKEFLMTRNAYFLWRDSTRGFKRFFVPGCYIGTRINHMKYLSDKGEEKCLEACLNGVWAAFRGNGGVYDPAFVMPSWLKAVFRFFVSWHPHFWIHLLRCDFIGVVRVAFARHQTKS